MDGATILRELVAFMANASAVFPTKYDQTWGPPLTGFMVYLGRCEGHHVRCGDLGEKVEVNVRTRGGAVLPPEYAPLIAAWDSNGLLAADACWVPTGFTIPKHFTNCPVPARSEITLIYEHEDESTTYRDKGTWTGTRMTAVLDEVRKIGNVRSDLKVVSYITSQQEIQTGDQIEAIRREILLVPDPAALTREWVILQIGRYLRPASGKAPIMEGGTRCVVIRMTSLDGAATLRGAEERRVPVP
jgi:hypothetical protein